MPIKSIQSACTCLLVVSLTLFTFAQDSVLTNKGCVPPCRSGFTCVDGKCVESCNPPCPAGEKCDRTGNCVSNQPATIMNSNTPKLITDDSVIYKKGIYKTYGEFKTNSPSIPFEYDIQSGTYPYQLLLALAVSDTFYTLKIEKAKTNEIGSIWGFCDGRNVYINREFSIWSSGKVIFKPNSKFNKILFIGRYCYFVSALINLNAYNRFLCGIDFNTGELFEINKNKVKNIISKDEELIQKFNNEGFWDKSSDLICCKYLKLYSEKHKDEIKKN